MAQKVVPVDVRLAAAVARKISKQKVNVSALCRELGISRQTFYDYEQRYRDGGLDAVMAPVSRRPRRSPQQTAAALEDVIVRLRKELVEDGWDAGATTLLAHLPGRLAGDPDLAELAALPLPSRATVHRILRRHGQVVDQPHKRPKSADLRFEYPNPNACWQVDAMHWTLADDTSVCIVQVLDDHSRLLLAHHVGPAENTETVWQALHKAMQRHGAPCQVLTDRGAAMLGRPTSLTLVKQNLTALGIACITSRGYHPQTCGKNERVHQTLQLWLRARPPAPTAAALQTLVDTFEVAYNRHRPHQSLGMDTPEQRYTASPKLGPGAELNPPALISTRSLVSARGMVSLAGPWEAHIGRRWEGCTITVLRQHHRVSLFHGDQHLLDLTIDPNKRYQSTGQPKDRGRTRRIRIKNNSS